MSQFLQPENVWGSSCDFSPNLLNGPYDVVSHQTNEPRSIVQMVDILGQLLNVVQDRNEQIQKIQEQSQQSDERSRRIEEWVQQLGNTTDLTVASVSAGRAEVKTLLENLKTRSDKVNKMTTQGLVKEVRNVKREVGLCLKSTEFESLKAQIEDLKESLKAQIEGLEAQIESLKTQHESFITF